MKNYYNILELNNFANQDEIKSSYRKLSLKYHPDKNQNNIEYDKNKIIEIIEAYECLSDCIKKLEYDNILNEYIGELKKNNEFVFNENNELAEAENNNILFKKLYEEIIYNKIPNYATAFFKNINKPLPIIVNLEITLYQSYNGCSIIIDIIRWVLINNDKINQNDIIQVDIPIGIDNGEIIVINDKGNIINNNNKGDVKIIIHIINDSNFIRKGLDLYYHKNITLKDLLCGFSFEIIHINNSHLKYNSFNNFEQHYFNIINNNFKLIIPNMGMKQNNKLGNLFIFFCINFPKYISEFQQKQLNNIL